MKTLPNSIPKKIMAVGAHADDIEINVGGTFEKSFRAGYEIVYVMSTNNMSGEVAVLDANGKRQISKEPNTQMIHRRKREAADAAKEWNTEPIHLDHPQRHYTDENLQRVDLRYGAPVPGSVQGNVPSILTACELAGPIEQLANLILEKNPELLFTHPLATYNPEHFCTTLLVANAYWKAVEQGYQGGLLFWIEPETRFGNAYIRWETYIDYSPLLDRKMELIGKHLCQMPNFKMQDFGHRILAKELGNACGCLAAECFIWGNRPNHREGIRPAYGSLSLELLNNGR